MTHHYCAGCDHVFCGTYSSSGGRDLGDWEHICLPEDCACAPCKAALSKAAKDYAPYGRDAFKRCCKCGVAKAKVAVPHKKK
jgi:hypothetical protein